MRKGQKAMCHAIETKQNKQDSYLPLSGEKILVTRPKERGFQLQDKLKALGAEVLSIPTIQTIPIKEQSRLQDIETELQQLHWYQVLTFTSPYGVECFFSLLIGSGRDIQAVSHMKFAVIGPRTAEVLMNRGFKADYMPKQYNGSFLGKLLAQTLENNIKILLARSSIGADEILQEINKNQTLIYKDLAIYDTRFMMEYASLLQSAMKDKRITTVIFTSSSTVEGFYKMLGIFPFETVRAVCIGKKTEEAAKRIGMKTISAANATIEDFIACFKLLE